jgi:uncharacterized protein YqjF (DUF2071 family)
MRLPVIRGVIERRILINYRVNPEVLASILPRPFRPQVVGGYGMAGICLIRLREVRPRGLPRWLGVGSENAAHRVAVEWDEGGEVRRGVYVLRRDTNSRLNVLAGGRIFPGIHRRAEFRVREHENGYDIDIRSQDGQMAIAIDAALTERWSDRSAFSSLAEASAFFEGGSLGYSPSGQHGRFQGLELKCNSWSALALQVGAVRSSLFDDQSAFPRGSVEFDCALLMRGIEHEWHGQGDLCCHRRTSAVVRSATHRYPGEILCHKTGRPLSARSI